MIMVLGAASPQHPHVSAYLHLPAGFIRDVEIPNVFGVILCPCRRTLFYDCQQDFAKQELYDLSLNSAISLFYTAKLFMVVGLHIRNLLVGMCF